MDSLDVPLAGPHESTSSTPSGRSEYVDAPTIPSNNHHRPTATTTTNSTTNTTTAASSHALPHPQQHNIEYFDLAPVNHSPNTELQNPSTHYFLGELENSTSPSPLQLHPIQSTHTHPTTTHPLQHNHHQQHPQNLYNLSVSNTFYDNNDKNYHFDTIPPFHHDQDRILNNNNSNYHNHNDNEEDENNQAKASTALLSSRYSSSRTREQVSFRTNPIDNEPFNSPSPSSDGTGTKLVLKNIVPSLKSSDSDSPISPQSPRAMSFASLPGSSHVNIDEIPLNTPDDALHDAENSGFRPSRGFLYAFGSICIITLAVALDATSLAIALPIMTMQIKGGDAIKAFWSGTSFLITSAVFQPIIAGLSNIFGRKELILISAAFFGVGSTLGAIAKSFTTILVGRSIQGIGGGGILTLGEIMLTDLVPLAYRGAWFGYLGSVWAIGSVAGPIMGASFAQGAPTWRWIFWINVPIVIIGAIAISLFLKLDKIGGKLSDKLARFDWIGSVVFCAFSVSILIPMTWGGIMYPWSHWRTLVPLIVGLIGILCFVYYEWYLTKKCWDQNGALLPGNNIEPIIRFTIFNNSTMVLTYIQTVLHGIILWSLLYFLPLYYQGVKLYSPLITGVAALPETGFVAPMAVMVGVISALTGHYRWAVWSGWALTTFGAGLLVLLKPETTVPNWIMLNIVISIGTGMLFTAMGLTVQAAGVPEDAGHAAGFYSFSRVIGQALGVAIGGVVFQNQVYSNLLNYPMLAPQAKQLAKEATELAFIIAHTTEKPRRTQLIQAYSDALSMIWVVMCAIAGIGFLLSIFVRGYTLEQAHKTSQGYKYNGVDEDEERTTSSLANHKYSAGAKSDAPYGAGAGSISNLEMSNLGTGYAMNSTSRPNISTTTVDQEPQIVGRKRGETMNSVLSTNVTETKPRQL